MSTLFESASVKFESASVKVVQIVPHFPSKPHGITDYALRLAECLLNDYGINSYFIVCKEEPLTLGDDRTKNCFDFVSLPNPNTQSFLDALTADVGHIIIHFEQYAASIVNIVKLAKKKRKFKLTVVFHEITFPLSLKSNVRNHLKSYLPMKDPGIFRGRRELARESDFIFTPTQKFKDTLSHWTQCPIIYLPCFSNVGEPLNVKPLKDRTPRIVVFGSAGTRARIYSNNAESLLCSCQSIGIKEVLDIGPSQDATGSFINSINSFRSQHKDISLVEAGEQRPEVVSSLLADSVAGLFDGVSRNPGTLGKSGVFAAYAAHGLLPISTKYDPSEQDGVLLDKHYITYNQKSHPLTYQDFQNIADNAYQWYNTHTLQACARAYSKILLKDG